MTRYNRVDCCGVSSWDEYINITDLNRKGWKESCINPRLEYEGSEIMEHYKMVAWVKKTLPNRFTDG